MAELIPPPLPADSDERLYRQVNKSWLDPADGLPSSMAFKPFPKDKGQLSVSLGSKVDAPGSYEFFTQKLGFNSVGVWAVTPADCATAQLESYWAPTRPTQENPNAVPNDAHGAVVFGDLPEKTARTLSKKLCELARARGCQHPTPGAATTPATTSPTPAPPPATSSASDLRDLRDGGEW